MCSRQRHATYQSVDVNPPSGFNPGLVRIPRNATHSIVSGACPSSCFKLDSIDYSLTHPETARLVASAPQAVVWDQRLFVAGMSSGGEKACRGDWGATGIGESRCEVGTGWRELEVQTQSQYDSANRVIYLKDTTASFFRHAPHRFRVEVSYKCQQQRSERIRAPCEVGDDQFLHSKPVLDYN